MTEIVPYLLARFEALQNNTIDVLVQRVTHTMERDVFTPLGQAGFTFSTPYLYTGLAFGGRPDFVDCADNLETFAGLCRQLRICVAAGSSHETVLQELLAATFIVRTREQYAFIEHIANGTCNVFVRDSASLSDVAIRGAGYLGDYKNGSRIFSREPLALVTRDNDSEWAALVNSAVQLPLTAEKLNLTKSKAQKILQDDGSHTNHEGYSQQMLLLSAAFGHYGEIYQRHLHDIYPREGLNRLYDTSYVDSGLFYVIPFGNLDVTRTLPMSGKTLDRVMQRGHLVCALNSESGLTQYNQQSMSWSGIAVEFCRALNAAVHLGETESIVYVDVSDSAEAHSLLRNGTVDVISGERLLLTNHTQHNVVYSSPWYYDKEGNAFGMATGPDDSTWQDFV